MDGAKLNCKKKGDFLLQFMGGGIPRRKIHLDRHFPLLIWLIVGKINRLYQEKGRQNEENLIVKLFKKRKNGEGGGNNGNKGKC